MINFEDCGIYPGGVKAVVETINKTLIEVGLRIESIPPAGRPLYNLKRLNEWAPSEQNWMFLDKSGYLERPIVQSDSMTDQERSVLTFLLDAIDAAPTKATDLILIAKRRDNRSIKFDQLVNELYAVSASMKDTLQKAREIRNRIR